MRERHCLLQKAVAVVEAGVAARPEEGRCQRILNPLEEQAGFARELVVKVGSQAQLGSMRAGLDHRLKGGCPTKPAQTTREQQVMELGSLLQ